MAPLFIVLGAVGAGDVLSMLTVRTSWRRWAQMFATFITAAAFAAASGYDSASILGWAVASAALGTLWARAVGWTQRAASTGQGHAPHRALATVVGVLIVLAGIVVITAFVPRASGQGLSGLIQDLPYGDGHHSPQWVLSVAASLLFLAETGNILVRLLLTSVSVPVAMNSGPRTAVEHTIRGGRLIGPLERFLVFGLALAGQPTAAALVISAKGLLRYPEIRHPERPRGAVTVAGHPNRPGSDTGSPSAAELSEYLVIGSLVSWTLALGLIVWLPAL